MKHKWNNCYGLSDDDMLDSDSFDNERARSRTRWYPEEFVVNNPCIELCILRTIYWKQM